MSTKRCRAARRCALLAAAGVAAWAALSAEQSRAEVIRLTDGSTLKGRLVAVHGDTLTIHLDLGAPIKIHRGLLESIVFAGVTGRPPAPIGPPAAAVDPTAVAGTGTIAVRFEDRGVSSKITINKRNDWDAHVRSNDIVVELVVDGVTAYSAVDTTTDKTIYLGHEKQLKNNAELQDFELQVPAGVRHCALVVRNRDPDTFREHFDPSPLNAVLDLGEISVQAGGVTRVDVRIDKGMLRMSDPKLYRADG